MKPLIFISLLGLLPATHAQEIRVRPPNTPIGIVDTIILAGNQKTRDYVILDEMSLKPGSTVTPEAIEYDRNRIYSLGLFTRVDIFYDSLDTTRFLFIDVNERWYVIPYPLFGFREGDPKKVYYGAGLLHNNFRGRNQKLFLSAAFGYDPSISFSFADPLFDRDRNLYVGVNLSGSRAHNRSEIESLRSGDFFERHYDANVTLGKRFTLFETAGLTPGIHAVSVSDYRQGRTVSPNGEDLFLYLTLAYAYDSRDLREYPMQGAFYSFAATRYGFGESHVSYLRLGGDLRRYIPLPGTLSLAARVHGTISAGGTVPTYNHAFFGYGEKIRGHFKTVFEGENLAGANLELRYPLLKARTITFSAVPLPPEFAVWRFGISLALFADAGTTWFRGERLRLASFASGYGGGVHFLLPYGYVLRTEYAWNEYGRGQFILDVRGSF